MKHIVCYSGGHSSGMVAIEVVRRFGADATILLNHDINPNVESADIKRFKAEVAAYLGIPITYANHPKWASMDQFDVCVEDRAFKAYDGPAICTSRLKTRPFEKFLKTYFPRPNGEDCIIYYGFDAKERVRIQRRSSYLALMGYRTDFPLALWKERTIEFSLDVGIEPPNAYETFKHANCVGCLKSGKQHWYCVYCLRPDIWEKAKRTEDIIGYSIVKWEPLETLEPTFKRMRCAGIEPTEWTPSGAFWANVRRVLADVHVSLDAESKPCECVF